MVSVMSLVSVQSRQFVFFQTPEQPKNIEDKAFFRALMSQDGYVENDMPMGEGQQKSEL